MSLIYIFQTTRSQDIFATVIVAGAFFFLFCSSFFRSKVFLPSPARLCIRELSVLLISRARLFTEAFFHPLLLDVFIALQRLKSRFPALSSSWGSSISRFYWQPFPPRDTVTTQHTNARKYTPLAGASALLLISNMFHTKFFGRLHAHTHTARIACWSWSLFTPPIKSFEPCILPGNLCHPMWANPKTNGSTFGTHTRTTQSDCFLHTRKPNCLH